MYNSSVTQGTLKTASKQISWFDVVHNIGSC